MKNHPSHPAFEADLKAFLDGELALLRRFQMRRHLQNCSQCREELRIMQTIESELKTEVSAPLGEDLRAKILENAPPEAPQVAPKPQIRLVPALGLSAAMLGIVAAVFFPTFSRSRENARRSGADSSVNQIGLGQQRYTQSYNAPTAAAPMAGAAGAARRSETDSLSRGAKMRDGLGAADYYLDGVVPAQRQVHKQGSIAVSVDDAEAKGSSVEILVKNVGGFVAQNALSTAGDGRKSATLDVRVPVTQFETIVAKIGKLGTVREKSVNGEDITQRVTQAGARRQSLARELSIREAQLRAARDKGKVAIVSDVRQLRFQASQARAQLEYLKKYAALATLFVTLQDQAKPAPVVSTTGELKQTARAAWGSFLSSAQLPIQLLIWILAYSPLWIPALLMWKKWGRKLMGAA